MNKMLTAMLIVGVPHLRRRDARGFVARPDPAARSTHPSESVDPKSWRGRSGASEHSKRLIGAAAFGAGDGRSDRCDRLRKLRAGTNGPANVGVPGCPC